MSDMDLDLPICARQPEILERQAAPLSDRVWLWSPETSFNYTPKRAEKLKIVQSLIAGIENEDFDHETSDASSEKPPKTDSGIESMPSMDTLYWEVPKIEIGMTYFVPNKRGKWVKAKLVEIKNSQLYLVGLQSLERIVSDFLSLAHPEPVLGLVPVGSRVVAHQRGIKPTGEIKRNGRRNFQLGVVAELPSQLNGSRYLVIFDNGAWNYIESKLVHPGYYTSEKIWEVVPIQNRKMVQDFLNGHYEHVIEWKREDQIWVKTDSDEGINCFQSILNV
nr:PREDICTED: histone-lysine N-methyltransferase eggless isoform X2 [Tribolium castaneum]|eukprot:XP_015837778.1 PREDICTED: histone-lysine N-methyltransferase eggless isoform X2 [Tribolium castaneum]